MSKNIMACFLCLSLSLLLSTDLMAQTPSLVSPAQDDTDTTVVTITSKKKPKIRSSITRFRADTASSCGYFSQTVADQDAVSDYLASMGYGVDPDAAGAFDSNSPFGDITRNTDEFTEDAIDSTSPYARPLGSDTARAEQRGAFEDDAETDSECGLADARFAAGRMHIARNDTTLNDAFDLFDQKKYPEALAMFKKSWDKIGYPEAALTIGKMYLMGLGTPKDSTSAVMWFKRVAELRATQDEHGFDPKKPGVQQPKAEAIMILVRLYLVGHDKIVKSETEAYKWLKRGDYIGYVPATHNMADFVYSGIGVTSDLTKARSLYAKVAKLGYAPSQYAYGQMLKAGEGGPLDLNMALGWFSEAAKAKNVGALYALGVAFDFGQGVGVNHKKALYYYFEAATKGHPKALNAVGTFFYEGKIIAKDFEAARHWFLAAAVRRNRDAMFNLAVMLTKGEGGPVDVKKAWAWFRIAKLLGHENAEKALIAVEKKMTPQELTEAKALAGV